MSAEHKIEAISLERRTTEEDRDLAVVEQLKRIDGQLKGFPVLGIPLEGEYVAQRDKAIEVANRLSVPYLEIDMDLVKLVRVAKWVDRGTRRMFRDVIIPPKRKR